MGVLAVTTILYGCFYNPRLIIAAIIILPVITLITLWAIFDRTKIEYIDGTYHISERSRLLSDKYKVHKSKIILFKIVNQSFINSGDETTLTGRAIGKWSKKAYKKPLLAIQTVKRVIRIGNHLEGDKVRELFKFIKNTI